MDSGRPFEESPVSSKSDNDTSDLSDDCSSPSPSSFSARKRKMDASGENVRGVRSSSNDCVQSWQETKPLVKDRLSYLINNERLSDIVFLLGEKETPVHGHKTVLSAGSPYFESLFYGPMATTEKSLKIPDMEPELFLEFLKYLYTDEFDKGMDDMDALLLLKPAKVYIVPHLAKKCTDVLITKLNAENVFLIYNRAIVFDEPKLADVCLRFIDRQIDKVICTEQFLEIDVGTLCNLLERDNLRINECELFKGVLSWSEAECRRQEKEPTPELQRSVLGRALHLIRFPTMTPEEFAIEVVPKNILNDTESLRVLAYLSIGADKKVHRPETPFAHTKRSFKPKLHYLNRFSDVLSKVLQAGNIFTSGDSVYNSTVRFQVDQRIFIHGVGVYAVTSSVSGLKFEATVKISRVSQVMETKTLEGSGRNYDFRMPFQVMFEKPHEIRQNEDYFLCATLKVVREGIFVHQNQFGTPVIPSPRSAFGQNPNSANFVFNNYGSHQIDAYYGTKCNPQISEDCCEGVKVTFTFPIQFGAEAFNSGQIPQLIFSI